MASPFAPDEDDAARDAVLLDSLPAGLLAKLDELFRTRPDRIIRIDPGQFLH